VVTGSGFTLRDAYDVLFRAGLASQPVEKTIPASGEPTLHFVVPDLVHAGKPAVGSIQVFADKKRYVNVANHYGVECREVVTRHLERNDARRAIVLISANGPIPDEWRATFGAAADGF
jgi:hypothetical protein